MIHVHVLVKRVIAEGRSRSRSRRSSRRIIPLHTTDKGGIGGGLGKSSFDRLPGNSTRDGGNMFWLFDFVLGIEDGVGDVGFVVVSLTERRGTPHVLDATEAQATILVVVIQALSHCNDVVPHFFLRGFGLGISDEARVVLLLSPFRQGRNEIDSRLSVERNILTFSSNWSLS